MRKAFNFYHSHWEQIKLLNDNQKLEIFNAICSVQFLEINIDDVLFEDKIIQLVWTGIKHSINTSLSGYLTKQKSLNKDINTPLAKGLNKGGSNAPCQQEKEKEKEQLSNMLENEFQELWKGYTLTFLKKQNRKGGSKAKAKANFLKLRKKYDCENIKEMVRDHARQKIGHMDLQRLLTFELMKQFEEDSQNKNIKQSNKKLVLLGEDNENS